jgi:hypothetical protein
LPGNRSVLLINKSEEIAQILRVGKSLAEEYIEFLNVGGIDE